MAAFDSTISNSDFFSALKGMTPFKEDSKALGGSKKIVKEVVKQEVSSPLKDMSNFFAGIDKSLINLVNFAKKSFGLDQQEAKDRSRKKLKAGDTDKSKPGKTKSPFDTISEVFTGMKEGFDKASIGEKLSAALLIGGLLVFNQVQDQLVAIITPIVSIIKGLVKFLGVGGTFNLFLATFLGFKLGIIQATARLVASKVLGPKGLKGAFDGMFKYINKTMIPGIRKSYKKGLFGKAFKSLSFAFKSLRLMLTATMYPAIIKMVTTLAASMGPILGPIVIIAAIMAGVVAVLFSLKSGIEAFKNSLESGDSMIVAIGKGLLDFSATLITLPITLLKNLLSYIAGLLGFDGIKEALDNFSFKDMIVNAFTCLIGGTIRLIKAIAKGAGAALAAAFPGGEGPGEAFGRVFKEVMSGGEGTMPDEGPEKGEGINRMDTSEVDINLDEKLPTNGKSFVDFALKGDKFKSDLPMTNIQATAKAAMTGDSTYNTTTNQEFNTKNMMKEKVKELIKEGIERERIERESKSSAPIMVNANKQGDVYNQKSETNVTGEIATEHSDPTSKMISNAVMA